jgi:hypothetical protein
MSVSGATVFDMTGWQIFLTSLGIAVSLVIGGSGLALSFRNYKWTQHAHVRDNQGKLRIGLYKTLKLMDFHHIEKALNQLGQRMPSNATRDEWWSLNQLILQDKDRYVAPSPQQLETLASSLKRAYDLYDELVHPADQPGLTLGDVPGEGRGQLADQLRLIRRQIQSVLDGINTIDQNALSVKKQRALFSDLDGANPPALPL